MPYLYGQMFNAQLENSRGDPASGGTPLGRIYIDITNVANAIPKFYNGSTYVPFGSSIATSNSTAVVTFNTDGNSEVVYNTNPATQAAVAINLPSTTTIGEILRYVSSGAVTAVTVTGTVVAGSALTTLAANGSVAWQAINTTGSFVRLY